MEYRLPMLRLKTSVAVAIALLLGVIALPAAAQLGGLRGTNCGFTGLNCSGSETVANVATVILIYANTFFIFIEVAAFIYLLYAGIMYITSTGDNQRANAAKMQILYAIIGLIVAFSAQLIVNAVVERDVTRLLAVVAEYTALVLLVIEAVAVLYLIYAGFQYITSQGDQQRAQQAKMQILYAVVGLVVALSAHAIVLSVETANVTPITSILAFIAQIALVLVDIVAVLYLIYAGYRYIMSRGETDEAATAKRQILYAVIGLIVASTATLLVSAVRREAAGQAGAIVGFAETILLPLINIALALAGIIALVYLIYAGYRYITSAGDANTADIARRQIVYTLLGLFVIAASFIIVNIVFNPAEGVADLINLITNLIAAVLGLLALIAVAYLVYAGFRYITATDEEAARRARQQIVYVIVGLVVILLSLIVVNFVINVLNAAGTGTGP